MHVVPSGSVEETRDAGFSGLPLSVVFAEAEAIERVRARGEGEIPLEPPFHVSDEDAYFVLPGDIGLEIVDILRDGDLELLHESLRDGLLVIGSVERADGDVVLFADEVASPAEALSRMPFVETVRIGDGEDPVETVNALPHVRCTVLSALVDDEAMEKMLREPEHLGTSWRVPRERGHLGIDPTYAWSRRLGPGAVGIELALFCEYEELVVLLRPVRLVAAID